MTLASGLDHCFVQIMVGVTSKANPNLYDATASLLKEFIGVGDPIKRKEVRQQWAQIQPAVADQFHQSSHTLLAARTQCRNNFVVAEAGSERLQWHG
jgi:hypothetical protein